MSDLYAMNGAAPAFIDRARDMNVPVMVTFQITDRCNYRCAHCYETHEDRDELSTDEVKRVLRDLAEAGVLFLTITGGEVYMRRDLDEILAEARRLRFAVRLYTTGHYINEARAQRLKDLAIQEVHLSLYGPDAETHEAVTLMPGSFERTVAAARRLRALDVFVVLKSPVMSVNVNKHVALRELVASLGCKYIMDAKVTTREDGERSPLHLRPSTEDMTEFFSTYEPQLSARMVRKVPYDRAVENTGSSCGIGRQACAINPKGLVFGCVSLPVAVGDLRTERFVDVWRHSAKLAELRAITWGDIEVCRSCELRTYCKRCHAMALLENGNMLGPAKESCRQAVALRESLRNRGLIPIDTPDTLPVPLQSGAAPVTRKIAEKLAYGFRSSALRILQ